MDNRDYDKLLLGGTVALPSCGGRITFLNIGSATEPQFMVESEETISPDASIIRTFRFEDIRAIHIPETHEWFMQGHQLTTLANDCLTNQDVLCGILYVPKDSPGLLEFKAGVTAASSLNFYGLLKQSRPDVLKPSDQATLQGSDQVACLTEQVMPGHSYGYVPSPGGVCGMDPHDPDPCPNPPINPNDPGQLPGGG